MGKRKKKTTITQTETTPVVTPPPTFSTIWKTVITISTGITAIMALIFAINVVLQPYYKLQSQITDLAAAIQHNGADIEAQDKAIDKIKVDKVIMSKILHQLLQEAIDGSISTEQLTRSLDYLEEHIVYSTDITDAELTDTPDTAQEAINKITQETLDALKNLE